MTPIKINKKNKSERKKEEAEKSDINKIQENLILENEKLKKEMNEMKKIVKIQKAENKKLIQLLETMKQKLSQNFINEGKMNVSELKPNSFFNYFEKNDNQKMDIFPNEKIESMVKSPNIVKFQSGLNIITRIEKDENHNFKDTGVKKIKQEIINLSKAEIQLENISIKCENII